MIAILQVSVCILEIPFSSFNNNFFYLAYADIPSVEEIILVICVVEYGRALWKDALLSINFMNWAFFYECDTCQCVSTCKNIGQRKWL